MPVPQLQIDYTDNTERTFYEPVTKRIIGTSQFRDNQFRIDGVGGFWEEGRDVNVTVGNTYELTLTSKPIPPGPNTKPGSMYLDIREAKSVPDEESDDEPPPFEFHIPDPRGYNAPATRPEPVPKGPPPKDAIQTRIEIGMAFNAAYTLLANHDDWITDAGIEQNIRSLRDQLYHQVILKPVEQPGYCYAHETQARLSSKYGTWFHQLPDPNNAEQLLTNVFCRAGQLVDNEGNPVEAE